MFAIDYSVKMFDTDASGFLFFTSQMRMAHEAFEAFMTSAGLSISHILKTGDYLLAIVHAETDYRAPSVVGDKLKIEITAERIGSTSFTLFYRFLSPHGKEVGTARTVHVAIDKAGLKKRDLPETIRSAVERLR